MTPDDHPIPDSEIETLIVPAPERAPEQSIPNFRLLRKLGEGGMGEVYEAEQLEPIRRTVAIKLIRKGMESREILGRFESERQALALMDHPGIAKVFDAGTTTDGRPYFVMEYVQGIPITRYCDESRSTLARRLELFILVCEAVQHAHHKGIIHRDLKPLNILVCLQDLRPQPKIIDFGIAKATLQRLTENTFYTSLGEFMGTPEYISPEQAEMTGLDVDTRSDVYSLGVILYELVVGALPFDPKKLRRSGFQEMLRIIKEEEPPKPVARFVELGEAAAAAAQKRSTEIRTLQREISGDLEWVIMKSLDKDRSRRYHSPQDFADDIGRYLRHEPVLAGPPDLLYKAKKFLARHKMGVLATAVVLLALLASVIGTTLGMVKARSAERKASREAAASREIASFLTDLFKISDPSEGRGRTVTAREILDKGVRKIENELKDQPETRARLMETMGNVYIGLGLYDSAKPLLERSLDLRKGLHPQVHRDIADSLRSLGVVHLNKGNYKEAEAYYKEALAIKERILGSIHPEVAMLVNNLALLYYYQGKYAEAEPLYKWALAVSEKAHRPDDPDVATFMNNLALLYGAQGKFAEAEPLYKNALAIWEKAHGPEHPDLAYPLNNLGIIYFSQGQFEQAERYYRKALAIREKTLGPEHPEVGHPVLGLADTMKAKGNYDEAERHYQRALTIWEKALGPDHAFVAYPLNGLADIHRIRERYPLAESPCRRALAIFEKAYGPNYPNNGSALKNLGLICAALGKNGEGGLVKKCVKAITRHGCERTWEWGCHRDSVFLQTRL
jgi:non-specific serine/threonine protein kinase/serine/threonine-protein kinase